MLCDWDGDYEDLQKVLNGQRKDEPVKSGKWRDGYYSNEPYNLQETDNYRNTDDGDSWHDLANPYESDILGDEQEGTDETDIADMDDISENVREHDEIGEIQAELNSHPNWK